MSLNNNIKTDKPKELFFVQLVDPAEVRKNLLEALKDILLILQKIERFKEMRQKKLEDIQKLRLLMRQTNKIMGDLKARMPETELKPVVPREKPARKQEAQPKKEKPIEVKKKDMTELEKLESELGEIESKLRSLQ